jgi:hypothetical protein
MGPVRTQRCPVRLHALRRRRTSVLRQRQHLRKERCVVSRGRGLRQEHIELVKFRLRRIVVLKPSGALYLPNGRIQCAVGVLRRANIT